jgi:hypothetical protein
LSSDAARRRRVIVQRRSNSDVVLWALDLVFEAFMVAAPPAAFPNGWLC